MGNIQNQLNYEKTISHKKSRKFEQFKCYLITLYIEVCVNGGLFETLQTKHIMDIKNILFLPEETLVFFLFCM